MRSDGVDDQNRVLFPGFRDRNVWVVVASDRLPVKAPPYLNGRVAFQDATHRRDLFAPIGRFLADREWRDLRSDWKQCLGIVQ